MLLQFIRERAQTWFAWVLISMLILVFAVWGVNSYFEPEAVVTVAKVNGSKIGENEYQRAFEAQKAQLRAQFGGNIDPALFESLGIKKQVLNRLVDEEVQVQTSLELGYRISDLQLAAHINQIQAFQREGKFDKELYEQVLSRVSTKPALWELEQRRALLLEQPLRGILATAFVTNADIATIAKLRDEKREVGYGTMPLAHFTDAAAIPDDELNKYFEANRDSYTAPEQVKVDYVELSAESIAKALPVTDELLKERYEQNKASYTTEERRQASHILIEVKATDKQEAIDQAKTKAEEVLAKVKAGEPFDKLAETYSQDPGSAKQGGDLGFFGRGVMDKAFEDAAFALKKSEVSGLVRSGFGFHIIKLVDIEAPKVKTFDEVRQALADEIKKGEAESQYYGQLDQLETLAFEHHDDLTQLADTLKLTVKSTDWFARTGGADPVSSNPKVLKAAFTQDVLNGSNSEVLELSTNHVAVIRLKEHRAAQQKPLAEVKDQVTAALKKDRAKQKAREAVAGALEKLKQGDDPVAVLAASGGEWKKATLIGRNEAGIDHGVLRAAFEAAKPAADKPVFGQAESANGEFAVYGVYRVELGSREALDKEAQKVLVDSGSQSRGQSEFSGIVETWKKSAKIELFADKI